MSFSNIEFSFENFIAEVERRAQEFSVAPFPKEETTPKKIEERLKKANSDFWYFDKVYFSKEMYQDGLSKPADFHKDLIKFANSPGVQIFLAARKHAKTAMMKKYFAWQILSGRLKFGGSLSSTLPLARNILCDIAALISSERIVFDYKPIFEELNGDQFVVKLPKDGKRRKFMAFSEGRSVRGATHGFFRPEKLLCDDLETRQSPLNDSSVEARVKMLSESYKSMGEKGVLIALGNNFDERCAMNRLFNEQESGVLPDDWHVRVYPAWHNEAPLWKERFPANSEQELRALLKPYDESEWQGDFMQKPTPPDGFIFKRLNPLPSYRSLPEDAKGVRWCDPNLSKKSKGDSTAIVSFYYSPKEDKFYASDIVCRSFSDSNVLLDAFYNCELSKIIALGFDGNVNQESTWTNNVRNYARIKNRPTKRIEYRNYRTDDLAKNIQGLWNEGKIYLPEKIGETKDGREFLTQIFAFSGKMAKLRDDAPDALICAHEFACERKIYRTAGTARPPLSITDYYNF